MMKKLLQVACVGLFSVSMAAYAAIPLGTAGETCADLEDNIAFMKIYMDDTLAGHILSSVTLKHYIHDHMEAKGCSNGHW